MEMFYEKYIIAHSLPANGKQMQLGVHSEDGSIATWEVCNGEHLWTHYFTDTEEATKDLCDRTLREINLSRSKNMGQYMESDYSITAIVKNEGNSAVIEFPTNELSDIWGSIGITEPPDRVCLGGSYNIGITPGTSKMAEALNRIFRKGDSLRLVNEVARAVYHADYRVYGMVEEKLKYGQFQTAGEILKEAASLSEKIKQQETKKTR